MITLVLGKSNKIGLKVRASVDITGYSAVFAACSSLKTIADITGKDLAFEFESGDFTETTKKPFLGTLMTCDAEGKEYLEFAPECQVVDEDSPEAIIGEQTFYLTIASTREAGEGGGGGDLSDYVTKAQLAVAIKGTKDYTDEQIENIGEVIIENEQIEVTTPTGTETMTVKEAVQQVANMQAEIAEAQATHTIAHVEDEDHDGQPDGGILYLNPSNPH
jgi:hypothetical protein